MNRTIQISILAAALATIAGIVIFGPRGTKPHKPLSTLEIVRTESGNAIAAYHTPKARTALNSFIDKWKNSPDKHVQDEVGAARVRLAYVSANEKNWQRARQEFKEAAKDYKGTGTMASDFGGVKDEALYQAAVTLNAEGKTAEYRKALIEFIKNQPLSPLVDAAYKRIVKLDGNATPEIDALLQGARNQQERKIRFEISTCGPRALAYLLNILGKGEFDYAALAKECGTTDNGSSLQGLRECLQKHGLHYFGFQVAKDDLPKIAVPAILLSGDHFLVITAANREGLTAYDPVAAQTTFIAFKEIKDPAFVANLLLPSAPDVDAN